MSAAALALVHGRIVDGTGRPPVDDATVLIEDGRVTVAGPSPTVAVPPGADVVDVGGRTVMPGLIDGHMHVTGMPGLLDEREMLRHHLVGSDVLRACLLHGTTTVGHASGAVESLVLRDLVAAGELPGRARLVVSGVVTATGGHVRGEGADGPWEVRKLARRLALAGVDFFKTCSTGGFQWSHEALGRPDYAREELEALVAEARLRDRLVHVHAHAAPGIDWAIEAGCDVILHGAGIERPSLEGIAERGLVLMPTLYITSEHSWGDGTRPEAQAARMRAACEPHRTGVAIAHELGITLAAGTDGWPRPGALVHELAELVACGLSPLEAIVAGTRNTACALGLGDRLGTLEPGKVADCVVVDGDPVADIAALTAPGAVVLVVKDGRVEVDRLSASEHH